MHDTVKLIIFQWIIFLMGDFVYLVVECFRKCIDLFICILLNELIIFLVSNIYSTRYYIRAASWHSG